jgi:hypothetical protein
VVFGVNPVSTTLVTPAVTVPVGVAPAVGEPAVVDTIYWYPLSGKGVGAVQETVTPVVVKEDVVKAVGGRHDGASTTLKVKSTYSPLVKVAQGLEGLELLKSVTTLIR